MLPVWLRIKKKILNAVYRVALFGWGRIAAGSKFLLTTSSCWQVAFRTGWACKLSHGSCLFERLLLFSIQVTAERVLCEILRLEKFQRENSSFVWTRLRAPSSACTSPEVVVNEWNQASCRRQLTPVCAFAGTVRTGVPSLWAIRAVSTSLLLSDGCLVQHMHWGWSKFPHLLWLVECWSRIAFGRNSRKKSSN